MTSRLQRVLAPLSVAAAFAVAAPAALAVPGTVQFPKMGTAVTTVQIVDPGVSSPTVHLTVTAATPADLVHTKVFLGGNATVSPDTAIGADGVHDARYDDDYSDLSTDTCSVYDSSLRYDVVVTTNPAGDEFSADLPKGELIDFDQTGVDVAIVGRESACSSHGVAGLTTDFLQDNQSITGFSWNNPAQPDITTATGGRQQVALSFDQERGTHYDIYKVVGGVRESAPLIENVRGNGDDVQVVITDDTDGHPLAPGTPYTFQVLAVRNFFLAGDLDSSSLFSPFSAPVTATTTPYQTVAFGAGPAASTTARSAQFSWSITDNPDGATPWCGLDVTETSGTEVPCTTTGAAVDGLALGAHTLTVYPDYSSDGFTYAWTVVDVPTVTPPPTPPAAPTAPKNPTDVDGDGIDNNWLVGGKAAPAPATPKASVSGGKVKLKLAGAPKGAKSVRVYRADGNGGYQLVKTLGAKSTAFTDAKVKPGHSYKYKTVAVNAKGQQGKASGAVTAKVKKK
jgi:hypothetical protein